MESTCVIRVLIVCVVCTCLTITYLVRPQETLKALQAAGYERAAVIGELLGLEEEGGEGGQQTLIELVASSKA